MQLKTKAIVISNVKFGESDLIVKCFTLEKGVVSFMLKGIRKSKKGRVRVSLFQPLTLLEIEAIYRENKNLQYLKEVKVDYPLKTLHTDIFKSTIVMFLAEVLKNSIQEEEKNEILFQFLKESLTYLDQVNSIKNFHLHFIVKLTSFLGFSPDQSSEAFPYFDMLNGIFQLKEHNTYSFNNANSILLKELIKLENYGEAENLKLNQERRKSFLDFMMLYYELQLQGFKKPKSLDVLQQLF